MSRIIPFKVLLSIIIFLAAYSFYSRISLLPDSVFNAHLSKAVAMERGEFFLLHFGFFVVAIGFEHILHLSLTNAFSLLCSFFVLLTFMSLMQYLEIFSSLSLKKERLCLLSLSLMVIGPVGLPFLDARIYNFAGFNRYILLLRNTTYTAAQPYTLLAFTYFCCLLADALKGNALRYRHVILASVTLLLATLIKPNFSLSFIPALMIVFYIYVKNGRTGANILFAAAIPSVIALIIQYYIGFSYMSGANVPDFPTYSQMAWEHNSFRLAPLVVWKKNNEFPLLSLLLSTLFPLYIAIGLKRLNVFSVLAWLNLAIALAPYVLLEETSLHGDRNFEWGFWFGLQIVFLTSVLEWINWIKEKKNYSSDCSTSTIFTIEGAEKIFMLHVFFGCMRLLYSFAAAN